MEQYISKLVKAVKGNILGRAFEVIPHRFLYEFDELLDIDEKELLDIIAVVGSKDQVIIDEIFDLIEKKIEGHLKHTTIPQRLYQKIYHIIDEANVGNFIIPYTLHIKDEDDKDFM